jgi:hypothetical protein
VRAPRAPWEVAADTCQSELLNADEREGFRKGWAAAVGFDGLLRHVENNAKLAGVFDGLAAREEPPTVGGSYNDASDQRKRASDALKGFRQEHDDPTGRLALADRVLVAAHEGTEPKTKLDQSRAERRRVWHPDAREVEKPDREKAKRRREEHEQPDGVCNCEFPGECLFEAGYKTREVEKLPGDGQRATLAQVETANSLRAILGDPSEDGVVGATRGDQEFFLRPDGTLESGLSFLAPGEYDSLPHKVVRDTEREHSEVAEGINDAHDAMQDADTEREHELLRECVRCGWRSDSGKPPCSHVAEEWEPEPAEDGRDLERWMVDYEHGEGEPQHAVLSWVTPRDLTTKLPEVGEYLVRESRAVTAEQHAEVLAKALDQFLLGGRPRGIGMAIVELRAAVEPTLQALGYRRGET